MTSLAGCSVACGTKDGGGGFVWKPTSDTKPGAVAIFPGRFNTQFLSVYVMSNGKLLATAEWAGWANPEGNGALRQHWKFKRRATNWPYNVVLHADVNCWRLENPRIRND